MVWLFDVICSIWNILKPLPILVCPGCFFWRPDVRLWARLRCYGCYVVRDHWSKSLWIHLCLSMLQRKTMLPHTITKRRIQWTGGPPRVHIQGENSKNKTPSATTLQRFAASLLKSHSYAAIPCYTMIQLILGQTAPSEILRMSNCFIPVDKRKNKSMIDYWYI